MKGYRLKARQWIGLSRKSLRVKIICGFVFLIFFPMLLIILLSSYFYNYNNKENYIHTLDVMVVQAADNLSLYLKDMEYLSELPLTNAQIMNELHNNSIHNRNYYIELNAQEVLRSFEETIMLYKKEISSVMIFDSSGRYIYKLRKSDTGLSTEFNPIRESWYPTIIESNGQSVLLGKHRLPLTEGGQLEVISIGKALRDYNGSFEPIAGILISLNVKELDHIFGKLNVMKGQRTIVATPNGGIVYDSNAEHAGSDQIEPEIQTYINRGGSNHQISFQGTKFVISHSKIAETGWSVISLIPRNQLSLSNNHITVLATILMAICLFLALVVSVLFSIRVTLPIKRLIATMKRVQQGNLEMKLRKEDKNEIFQISHEFNKMIRKINRLIQMLHVARYKQKEAELNALKLKIHPHFLFNTLESIHMMAELNNDAETSIMTRKLGKFYRYYITEDKDETVSLQEELDHLNSYISLQKYRFGDRFLVMFNIPGELYECRVLKFVFQPIVENAIQHGFSQTMKDGVLKISGLKQENVLAFEIADNGSGIAVDMLKALQERLAERGGKSPATDFASPEEAGGLGLTNVNERIKLYYGEEYGLSIKSGGQAGTAVRITIPCQLRSSFGMNDFVQQRV